MARGYGGDVVFFALQMEPAIQPTHAHLGALAFDFSDRWCAAFCRAVSLRTVGLVRPDRVPSDGMSPSIKKGDHIMVERLSVFFQEPKREKSLFSLSPTFLKSSLAA